GRGPGRAQAPDDLLQLRQAGNDDPNRENAKVVQQPEVVQVPVVKLRLVVPLDLDPHAVAEVVDVVRGDRDFRPVHFDLNVEVPFGPAAPSQEPVDGNGDRRPRAAGGDDVASAQSELVQTIQEVLKLCGVIGLEDGAGVAALLEGVLLPKASRD